MLYQTYTFTKSLRLFTCQIFSFKSGKINLRKKLNDESLSKIPIQRRAHRDRNACSKEKKIVTIIFHKKNKINTTKRFAVTILKTLSVKISLVEGDKN